MGGPAPLGYDIIERRLVVNNTEAATVEPIFDRDLELGSVWDRVRIQLAGNRIRHVSATNADHHNLLRGLLYDGVNRRMQGSQAIRGARRYHYYVTYPADALTTPGQSWRMPAADLKATVVQRLTAFLGNSSALYDAATEEQLPDHALAEFILRANVGLHDQS